MGKAEGSRHGLPLGIRRGLANHREILARLFATFIALAVLGVAGLVAYGIGERVAIRALEATAIHQMDVFRASFFSPIERYEYIPKFLARYPVVSDTLVHPGSRRFARLNDFLKSANTMAKSAAIYVMDDKGMTIASSNWNTRDSYVGKNFSYRPYFKDAIQGGPGRFYGVGAVTGIPGYFLSYPVTAGGRHVGVVAIKIDLDNLDRQWEGNADQVTVTDDSGIIFLSSNRDWKYRTTRPLSAAEVARLRETRQYASTLKPALGITPDPAWPGSDVVRIENPDYPGESTRYLVQRYELPDAKWTVSTYSDMSAIDDAAIRYALAAAGGAAFLVLLAMYILQVRKRATEKEAARKAAHAAHEKLEAQHAELEALSRHLKTMSISDPLTGCYNRYYFQEISAKMVSAAQRHRRRISILMLDVDFFKKINDSHGHPAGDELLKGVAQACRATLREPDFLVRFGGEEFVAVLPDTSGDEALVVAERLRAAVEMLKVPADAMELRATVSIGLSEYADNETSLEKALARADMALYGAKREGRNRIFAYSPEMAGIESTGATAV